MKPAPFAYHRPTTLDGAVRLLADVVVHPRLPESELERLKSNNLRQIADPMPPPAPVTSATRPSRCDM